MKWKDEFQEAKLYNLKVKKEYERSRKKDNGRQVKNKKETKKMEKRGQILQRKMMRKEENHRINFQKLDLMMSG